MTNIPTDLLRTLVAVVDLRSFTKAAQSLGITQPAVSAQIKALESDVGVALFRRHTRAVALTQEGAELLPGIRRARISASTRWNTRSPSRPRCWAACSGRNAKLRGRRPVFGHTCWWPLVPHSLCWAHGPPA